MSFNPYQPPTSAYDGAYTNPNSSGVSERVIASMRKTRPWVVFFAVLNLLYVGLVALSALAGLASGEIAIVFGSLIGGAIVAIPGITMLRYSSAINKLLHGGGQAELEGAIEAQASFWHATGILALVSIVLVVFAMMIAISVGADLINGL